MPRSPALAVELADAGDVLSPASYDPAAPNLCPGSNSVPSRQSAKRMPASFRASATTAVALPRLAAILVSELAEAVASFAGRAGSAPDRVKLRGGKRGSRVRQACRLSVMTGRVRPGYDPDALTGDSLPDPDGWVCTRRYIGATMPAIPPSRLRHPTATCVRFGSLKEE